MKPAQNLEKRDKARLPFVCPISVKDLMSDKIYSARIFNYSDTGIYFVSNALLEPGAEVYISLRQSPFENRPSDCTCYRAIIMWRKVSKEDSHFMYGYGTQIFSPKSPEKAKLPSEQPRHLRMPFREFTLSPVVPDCARPASIPVGTSCGCVCVSPLAKSPKL